MSVPTEKVVAEMGASSPRGMGEVMATVMVEGGVLVDGKLASRLAKERLSQ
jgi:uncharacterized protein YqeY